jgi:hypothetical protein
LQSDEFIVAGLRADESIVALGMLGILVAVREGQKGEISNGFTKHIL